MTCQEIEELAGAYALQALPPETLEEVRLHLGSCRNHPQIEALLAVAQSLGWTSPEKDPPPRLKARIMDGVRREMPPSASGRSVRRPLFHGWPRPRLSPYALAAALAVAVVGLLGWNISLQLSGDGGQPDTLVRTLADEGRASGRLTYIREERLVLLTVTDLPPLPPDRTYQVWAISDDGPTGIGLFDAAETGPTSTIIEVDLSGVDVIAVTVEPAGGSPQPTTDPVLAAEI